MKRITILYIMAAVIFLLVSCGTNKQARRGCRATWGMSGY